MHFTRHPAVIICAGCTQPIRAHPITGYIHIDNRYWHADGHRASRSHPHMPGIDIQPTPLHTYGRQLRHMKPARKKTRTHGTN